MYLLIVLLTCSFYCIEDAKQSNRPVVLFQGSSNTELAPHKKGNVYAPEILIDQGIYKMWYGGQGIDGHDRIHYAQSKDGVRWQRKGVVLEDKRVNHTNDPSVVKVGGRYLMYYTAARFGVTDRIDVATSTDGIKWKRQAVALQHGKKGTWDSLLVGRPSVLYENGIYKMWFDGRKDLPLGAPDKNAPKSAISKRSVGFATSRNGLNWTKHEKNPVFENNAGGIHVTRFNSHYLMVYESHQGTMLAHSKDEISWTASGCLRKSSTRGIDPHGHVTPFLLITGNKKRCTLFFGAATAATWDRNCIARIELHKSLISKQIKSITKK